MDKALADFAQAPLSYDLHDPMSDEEIEEMAHQVAALRKELYESAGRKPQLPCEGGGHEESAPRLGWGRWLHRHQPHHGGGLQGWLLLPGGAGWRLGQRLALHRR